jgi:predicted alpha/beta superfamily hydrolase
MNKPKIELLDKPNLKETYMVIKSWLILIALLVFGNLNIDACTVGVASGKATSDGRPMLWKSRDFKEFPNIMYYTKTDQYNYVSNITPEWGYNESYYGANEKGFAIANTYITDFPKGVSGFENGTLMSYALANCITVHDFIDILDSTNAIGRSTRAVFGVIDAKGGALIIEANADKYWKYDANNVKTAPNGFIVRANFALGIGGTSGIERYERSTLLINDYYKSNNLNVRSILQGQIRDVPNSKQESVLLQNNPPVLYDCSGKICNPNTLSASVIQGVKDNEPSHLITVWAMLGHPLSSITVPYWPVGDTPKSSSSLDEDGLYKTSYNLRKYIFDSPSQAYMIRTAKAIELNKNLLKVENSILIEADNLLEKWRKDAPITNDMLKAEEQFVNKALKSISHINDSINCINKPSSNRFIQLNDFSDEGLHNGTRTINIVLPSDYENSKESCRVLYVFDGESVSSNAIEPDNPGKIISFYDSLYNDGLIHPTIFVGIQNNGTRFSELTPTLGRYSQGRAGELESFYKFISQVLKPYVDANYRTLPKPEFTGIIGHSLGGLASGYLVHEHPETFGMAGCMSPSFWWDDRMMLSEFAETFKYTKPRIWIMSADVNLTGMWDVAHYAAKTLLNNGWLEGENLAFHHVYGGEHNMITAGMQMRDMLYFLLRKKKPELIKTKIATLMSDEIESPFRLNVSDSIYLYLELNQTNRFSSNAISPKIEIADTNIVSIGDSILGLVYAKTVGVTKVSVSYKGFTSEMKVAVDGVIYRSSSLKDIQYDHDSPNN